MKRNQKARMMLSMRNLPRNKAGYTQADFGCQIVKVVIRYLKFEMRVDENEY